MNVASVSPLGKPLGGLLGRLGGLLGRLGGLLDRLGRLLASHGTSWRYLKLTKSLRAYAELTRSLRELTRSLRADDTIVNTEFHVNEALTPLRHSLTGNSVQFPC